MIGRLVGRVVEDAPDGAVVLDVSGVGYEVFVPASAHASLATRLRGEEVVLHIHTNVREDAITLYGFLATEDRTAFRVLLTVSGIGPKLALAILSQLDADALAHAIESGDKLAFKGISGVGKKTVEHLLVDLKGKLALRAGGPGRGPARPLPAAPHAELVVGLLCNMGFRRAEAEAAVAALEPASFEQKPVDALLRDALARLR